MKRFTLIAAALLLPLVCGSQSTPQMLQAVIAKKNAAGGTDSPGTANLVAWWALDEASGNALDAHTGSIDGTDVNTVTAATGVVSGARSFASGNDESFNMGDTASLEFGGSSSFSIAGWINPDSTGADMIMASKWNTSSNRESMLRFEDPADQMQFYVSADGSSNTSVANTSGPVMTAGGGWYFVYAYFDNANDEIGISVNNGTVDTAAFASNLHTGTATFQLGSADYASPPDLDGQLDEVAVFNRVLTAAEVTWLYNSGSGRAYGDL